MYLYVTEFNKNLIRLLKALLCIHNAFIQQKYIHIFFIANK